MNTRIAILLAAGMLDGCSAPAGNTFAGLPPSTAPVQFEKVETTPDGSSTAYTVDSYKRDLAQRIAAVNSTKIYPGRPQALLRSVVVLRYAVDARGNLVHSEVIRSNRDDASEATALDSLRNTSPFPKPLPHLLRNGRLEISETWLFNNDGRFQLRTIALPQMDE